MRQLSAFLDRIHTRNTTKFYYESKLHATLHRAEIPSLEEVLGVPSEEEQAFDAQTETEMDKLALKMLEERKAARNV